MTKINYFHTTIVNVSSLKNYFLVDSNYIIWKIKKLLIPFLDYEYSPNIIESNTKKTPFYPPNLYYPELFTPLLGFLFYIFLTTFYRMSKSYFLLSPDIAISIIIKDCCLIILESLIIKTILSISNNFFIPLMDLICFASNKFFTLSICSLFAYFKILFFICILYSISINAKIMRESITQKYKKENNLLLSFIYIFSDLIVLIDLI